MLSLVPVKKLSAQRTSLPAASCRDGVWELRINVGPGCRVYYGMGHQTIVFLLCGGDKRKQQADIRRAVDYWKNIQRGYQ